MKSDATLRAGDWVEVRSGEEILRTLDGDACLDSMPFMPEMMKYAGQRLQVSKRAQRTCDTIDYIGGRHLKRTVHLADVRCDGSAHGGCQAVCLLFWKEAWLKKVDDAVEGTGTPVNVMKQYRQGDSTSEDKLWRGTRKTPDAKDDADPTYVCQATKLLDATVPLRPLDLGPYVEDVASGNVGIGQMIARFSYVAFSFVVGGRYGLGTPLVWLYDTVQKLIGGSPYPERRGRIPKGAKTPSRRLDLQAGELVRVRTLDEILQTVDETLRNRGMVWHSEMVQFTGRVFRVARRVERIINEKTGRMIHLKNDVIILENAICKGKYINNCRRFCPRGVYTYFREIWLERLPEPRGTGDGDKNLASPIVR
jgi:hypothetical protein